MDTASGFLGKLVSVRYTLTAELGEQTLEADVFAIDRALRRLVFRRSHAHTWMKADYYFLPASSISEITMIREGDKTAVVPIGLKEIERRIANSTRIEERKIAVRGVGVTEEAQRIFNGLLVHYPRATWSGQTIVLDDQGTCLKPPYTLESITFSQQSQQQAGDRTQFLRYFNERLPLVRAQAFSSDAATAEGSPASAAAPAVAVASA